MRHHDLLVIGSGSGNSLLTPETDGWDVGIVEAGTFGGTCLNVGCIPTKMYVYAADIAQDVREAARYGVDATLDGVRWPDVRDRVFGRIDPISAGGRDYRASAERVTLYEAEARFTGPREIVLSTGERVSADRVVIAAGARALVPPGIAQSGVPFHTSDTVMRLERLPRRLVIVGSGYVAAEFAHVFGAFGTEVTWLCRGPKLLAAQDHEISQRFTAHAQQRWDVRLNTVPTAIEGDADEVRLTLPDGSTLTADTLLVAIGRQPNGDRLDPAAAGVRMLPDGRIWVDEQQRTSAEGVWALGDVSSEHQLKHVANHEARVVAHNITHPDDPVLSDHRFVPSAVFTHPQIASVGLTEYQAMSRELPYVTYVQHYGSTAYGWAMEDVTGVCKVIADSVTGELLGAHIMGADASTLIQPLIQAMSFGLRARETARGQYWIHPALSEVVENALLGLDLP